MSESGAEKQTIDQVVESFVGRMRAGEHPSIETYQKLHPHLAEEIGRGSRVEKAPSSFRLMMSTGRCR